MRLTEEERLIEEAKSAKAAERRKKKHEQREFWREYPKKKAEWDKVVLEMQQAEIGRVIGYFMAYKEKKTSPEK